MKQTIIKGILLAFLSVVVGVVSNELYFEHKMKENKAKAAETPEIHYGLVEGKFEGFTVKQFCWKGQLHRMFILGNATWGEMILTEGGQPIKCGKTNEQS